jgi:VWFA-related protein
MRRIAPGLLLGPAVAAALAVSASGQQPVQPTFRGGVRLIDVDVVVTDQNGRPIRGLTADDFEIVEDGRPQTIRTFSVVDLPFDPPAVLAERRSRDVEPDVVTNTAPEGRTYVLLIDAGNLRARHVAERWLDEVVQPSDRVAVVHAQGTFSDSQSFTSSRRLILQSIDRMIWGASAAGDARPVHLRPLDTLRALREIAERLGAVAGRRKAIVWLGDGINLHPHARLTVNAAGPPDRFVTQMAELLTSWQETARAAVDNNVAIYPVDPTGLTETLGVVELARIDSLREVAEETGGVTVGVSTNTFSEGFATIVQDASAYYLLGYSPEPEHTDGKFHPIRVRVKRPDVTVRARRGYYAPDPAREASAAAAPAASLPEGVSTAAAAALRRPVPVAGLGVDVFTLPFRGTGRDGSVLIGAHVHARDLDLSAGRTLAVSYQVFDLEGRVATGAYKVFEMNLEPARRDVAADTGFRFLERVTLRPGRYELRLVAEQPDRALGSVHAHIEVPDYRGPLLMSGVALASQDASQEVALVGDETLERALRAEPTARRRFHARERLVAFVEVYTAAQRFGEDEGVEVTGTLAPPGGDTVRRVTARSAGIPGRGPGAYGFRADIPLAGLTPGTYVLTLEARSARQRNKPVTRQVPFTVAD